MQRIVEVMIVCLSTLMFRTFFLGSCPILLHVIAQAIIRKNRSERTVVQYHDHHQRAGLPSDAVPHCVQELV